MPLLKPPRPNDPAEKTITVFMVKLHLLNITGEQSAPKIRIRDYLRLPLLKPPSPIDRAEKSISNPKIKYTPFLRSL